MNVTRVGTVALTVVLGAAGAAFAYARESPTPAAPTLRSPRPETVRCAPADLARSAWTGVRSPQDPLNAVVVLLSNNHMGRCPMAGTERIPDCAIEVGEWHVIPPILHTRVSPFSGSSPAGRQP